MYQKLKNRLLIILSVFLFSFLLILSINQLVSGESKDYSTMESDINAIIDGDENFAVFIRTKDGDIGINEEKVYSSASTIKVPILAEALRQGDQGIINLDEKVTVTDDEITSGGGIVRHMSDNQILSIRDLLYLMIILSDNTTTNMSIERVGMGSVNAAIDEMGAENTRLQRYMMESVTPRDNLTTAKDMVTILQDIYEGDFLTSENKQEFLRIMGDQKLKTLDTYKGSHHSGVTLYSKGGSLGSTSVRHNVGMFTYQDEVAYVSVMSQNAESKSVGIKMAEVGERIMDYLVE